MKSITSAFLFLILSLSISTIAQEKIYTSINEKGEKLFSLKAKYVYPFEDGMARVEKTVLIDTKPVLLYGYINSTGTQVIPCRYDKVYDFVNGVAWVKNPSENGFHLIDKSGNRLNDKNYLKVGYFFEGMCAVYDEEGKMGFVNSKGELDVPFKYSGASYYSDGLTCVAAYNGVEIYGFIDKNGVFVIPYTYKMAGFTSFEDGEARVSINGVMCLINKAGEVVFKPTLTKNCSGFHNGLSASYTNTANRSGWGYYNRNNEWVIKPQYDYAKSFENGLAICRKGW